MDLENVTLDTFKWLFHTKNADDMGPRSLNDHNLIVNKDFILLSDMDSPLSLRNGNSIIARAYDLSKYNSVKEFCFEIMTQNDWAAIYQFLPEKKSIRIATGKFSDLLGKSDIVHVVFK